MKQLDIFGNEIDIEIINAEVKKTESWKIIYKRYI